VDPVIDLDIDRHATAYDSLKREILSGRLAPGAKLKPSSFAAQLDVSSQVIREALVRLAGERLVVRRANYGFSMLSLTRTQLEQHTEARIAVDGVALKLAGERGDLRWESHVVGDLHRLLNTPLMTQDPEPRISDDWAAAHASFHHSLVAGCENSYLLDLRSQLAATADMLIRWAAVADTEHPSEEEHKRLADLVLARDTAGAAALLEVHYRRTAQRILPMLPHTRDDAF
jgi:DNA-binding GntR family transcriptional regulator